MYPIHLYNVLCGHEYAKHIVNDLIVERKVQQF